MEDELGRYEEQHENKVRIISLWAKSRNYDTEYEARVLIFDSQVRCHFVLSTHLK
jgi:hypothetical protein